MLKLISRSGIALAALAALACGPKGSGDTTPDPGDAPVDPELLPQDMPFEYQAEDLPGTYFVPEALGAPGMPQVTPAKKIALDAQRKKAAAKNAKPVEVHVLATMLWNEAGSQGEKGQALRTEARDALRALHGRGAADELTLQMLASVEIWLGDHEAALPVLEALVEKFPASKGAPTFKTWLAYLYLQRGRNSDAAKVAEGWDPAAADTTPMAAYVVAWIKFRARDVAGARAAIEAAARGWEGDGGRDALLRDVQLFAARSGAPANAAAEAVAGVVGKDPTKRAVAIYKLHDAYVLSGQYARAVEVLDILAGAAMAPDLVSFRYSQSDYEFRQNRPVEAAARVTAAWEALGKCEQCPEQTKAAVAKRIGDLARVFHTTYAASLDDRHGEAAKTLYALYETTGQADVETVKGYKASLEETIAKANKADGKHDAGVMQNAVRARREALIACYDGVLNAEPALSGALKLIIDVGPSGEVTGVTSEPAAGAEGLAAVGQCAAETIKQWSFPSRTVPGTTRLVYPFNLKPQPAA